MLTLHTKLQEMKKYLLLYVLFFFAGYSYAQDFEVSPVALEYKLEPGESESKTFKITNYAAKKYNFILEMFDEDYSGEKIERYLPAGSTKNSLANWININPTYLEVGPNETKYVDVTLSVPANQKESKWGAIGVRTAEERSAFDADKSLSTGISVSPRIKVTITQTPPSNLNYSAKFNSLSEVGLTEDGRKIFKVSVTNTSDKVINPKVSLLLANLSTGKEVKESPITFTVLPGQTKSINLELSSVLQPGQYALAAVMDYSKYAPLEVTQITLNE